MDQALTELIDLPVQFVLLILRLTLKHLVETRPVDGLPYPDCIFHQQPMQFESIVQYEDKFLPPVMKSLYDVPYLQQCAHTDQNDQQRYSQLKPEQTLPNQ